MKKMMRGEVVQSWHMLLNGILTLISCKPRLVMLIATLVSEDESHKDECLSLEEYVRITKLPDKEVQEHVEILCEANLLKPVGSKVYDITELGRSTLRALGVTDDLVKRYKETH
jgi:hypothetical protein